MAESPGASNTVEEIPVRTGMDFKKPAPVAASLEDFERPVFLPETDWESLNRQLFYYIQAARLCLEHKGGTNRELQEKIDSFSHLETEWKNLLERIGARSPNLKKIFRHDFASSFNILGMIELLQFGGPIPPEHMQSLHLALIKIPAYFQALRFWTDGPAPMPSPTSLEVAFEKIGPSMSEIFAKKTGGKCEFFIQETGLLTANEQTLWLLLDNIAKNARKHGDARRLQISVTDEGDFVEVSISDDGKGVDDSVKNTLFERGVTSGDGHGIGLADAIQRMATMHGSIDCEAHGGLPSRHEGIERGAKFVITLSKV